MYKVSLLKLSIFIGIITILIMKYILELNIGLVYTLYIIYTEIYLLIYILCNTVYA